MECLFCKSSNLSEYNISVEGKVYGVLIKGKDKKNKRKLEGVLCEDCGMVFFKAGDEGKC